MNVKTNKVVSILEQAAAKFFLTQTQFRPGIVTVTGVDVTKDKHHATVWIALYKVDKELFEKALPKLQSALRHSVSSHEAFRYTPALFLKVDTSSQDVQKLNLLLKG